MIPEFPEFKPLELSDREEIIKHTSKFVPYSDFNFTSLWSWNVENKFLICSLNGNLVIKFLDYIDETPFISFIGNNKIEHTINVLIEYARANNFDFSLRLVPEEDLVGFEKNKSSFCIEEDRDNFDYILSIQKLIDYKGNKLRGKRNFTSRFKKMYDSASSDIDVCNKKAREDILKVLEGWSSEKLAAGEEPNHKEAKAIEKVLNSKLSNIICMGVYVEEKMIGFIVGEILSGGYAILHFEKAISNTYVGIYPYMMQCFAQMLAKKGCEFINYEQDLGIPGLRQSKQSYQPIMIKKYTIKKVV